LFQEPQAKRNVRTKEHGTMESMVTVDFGLEAGRIRQRLHGAGFSPSFAFRGIQDLTPALKEMNFSALRTHDWALFNPGQRIIDTHFVFPLMNQDPSDPANYYFAATDDILGMCRLEGIPVSYRLGSSIDHRGKNPHNVLPPADPVAYAEVLAGIVRHYTRGWANGFEWGDTMREWAIWEEPDSVPMLWRGSAEEFCRLFAIVLKRLKREFPELKFGGPSLCSCKLDYFNRLLAACREAGTEPDFISWNGYGSNVAAMAAQPEQARKMLDEAGLRKCEISLTEWHYLLKWEGLHANVTPESYKDAVSGATGMHGIDSAVFNLALLTALHDTPLDSAFYYGCGYDGTWGIRTVYKDMNKNFYSLKLFGELVSGYQTRVRTSSAADTLYALGTISEDEKRGALLVSDYRGTNTSVTVSVKGMDGATLSAVVLDDRRNLRPLRVTCADGLLELPKRAPGSAGFLMTFERP
jgi:hypothetical protein